MRCSCGTVLLNSKEAKHRRGLWHRRHKAIRQLLKENVTISEIARIEKVTRASIQQLVTQFNLCPPKPLSLTYETFFQNHTEADIVYSLRCALSAKELDVRGEVGGGNTPHVDLIVGDPQTQRLALIEAK